MMSTTIDSHVRNSAVSGVCITKGRLRPARTHNVRYKIGVSSSTSTTIQRKTTNAVKKRPPVTSVAANATGAQVAVTASEVRSTVRIACVRVREPVRLETGAVCALGESIPRFYRRTVTSCGSCSYRSITTISGGVASRQLIVENPTPAVVCTHDRDARRYVPAGYGSE